VTERVVLVTAVGGGGVGEQLVKALRLAPRPYRIVGADVEARSLGLQEVDLPVLLPLAAAPDYVDTALSLCSRLNIRAVFPGSEPELVVLSAARARFSAAGVVLFANSDAVIATGLDKAKTAEFLTAHGFRPPRTVIVTDRSELAAVSILPAVLKPNTSSGGSANVFVAQTEAELRLFGTYLLDNFTSCLVQEYVGDAAHEYTVGVLSDLDGGLIHSIAVRRNILPAFSNRSRVKNRTGNPAFGAQLVVSNGITQGEIGPFPEVTESCERIAAALDSRGPLNAQCRLVDGEVRVFEINPRFSGSASLRAMVGFNEPDLLYRRHVEGERLPTRFPYRSGRIARGLREVLIDPALDGAQVAAGDFRWTLPALPFIYRPLETPSNGAGIPDALPLTLTVEAGSGLVRQAPDPAVALALERAYAAGSEIPGLLEEQGIGREYAEDFLALLAESTGAARLEGKRVLEIGCGTGYLLSRLKGLGADVLGIEPGPHGQQGPVEYGVPVVRGWFPSAEIRGLYDLIVLYLVLEHIPEPAVLLGALRGRIAPGGRVAMVVPDAGPFLEEGDASILFHEHYSYFTAATLAATLRQAGALAIQVQNSALSRLLFTIFSFESSPQEPEPLEPSLAASLALAHHFRTGVARTTARLVAYLGEARALREEVALYVPGRFVNYIPLGGLSTSGIRFFDDSPALHGRYFPGLPIAVEALADLVARPCPRVLIMSTSFGARIKTRIAPLLPASTRITTFGELLR
jgi:carbamoyl-phosphate synthase large subunit